MFYVSHIEEYPIYEPAEGGYYYPGETVVECVACRTWKKAQRIFSKMKKDFRERYEDEWGRIYENNFGGVGKYVNPFIVFDSHLIGDGAKIEITRIKPRDRGWRPYC